jgi:hypothetical protein
LKGNQISDALVQGNLIVKFKKGKADNPKINAILLVNGGLKSTHQEIHQRYIEQLTEARQMYME